VVTVAAGNVRSAQGTWTEDGFILFTQPTAELPGQILRVRADGGNPEPLPTTDEGRRQPVGSVSAMPGSPFLLLTVGNFSTAGSQVGSFATGEGRAVAVQSLETGERRVLAPGGSLPRLLAGGHVVYRHSGRLMAGRLDAGATRLVGTPVPLDAVTGGADVDWFDVSPGGTLVFMASRDDDDDARFARTSRDGLTVPLPAEVAGGDPRLSPDGTRLVFDGPQQDVWVMDLERGALTRISSAPGEDETGAWSPDGRWIAWTGSRPGEKRALFRRRSDGSGPDERLWSDERHLHVASWTAAGIVVTVSDPRTGWDVLLVDPDKGEAKPVLDGRFNETSPRVSPDGRLVAFVSDETGRSEVYVRSFPEPSGKVQVSLDGGVQPVWRPGTREIVYRGSKKIMSATLGPGDAPAVTAPRPLLDDRLGGLEDTDHTAFAVLRDGSLLAVAAPDRPPVRDVRIVLDWTRSARLDR
jgi:dipeptidyl aminopeptidase/acylaminoacyl peptidase